ncbi:sensor histidine kinase [Micromonospora sp. R77]|uniref:anti-sigma factor RsbA family regulatory protein n=1 Tax=Micromonospora sp. R77 TaxID=2925836 RepID=UPI001F621055|nr:anti-sigma factor RsbA family regulatory protein [Micromonospora sp. R77]MCI4065162.1 sensor histidine kinase [Micromonospora sp. R77]
MTRTGAAAGHVGYFHEAIFFDSDEHLLAVVVPFLLDGVAAGEPALVGFGERNSDLVRRALPAGSPVTFLPGGDVYARPTGAIRSYRQLLSSYVAEGAQQIRIVGELPAADLGSTWDWWARYEAAINHAYDDFPLWSMCAYDTRIAPARVLDDVARTHPRVACPDGTHVPTGVYTDPRRYLTEPRPMLPDPVQRTAPMVELTDPTPAQARAAVHAADRGQLPAEDIDDLVVAVSETVTNALRHGKPQVRMTLWAAEDRIVVSVRDAGPGPTDPFAGLLPSATETAGGLGLWISYQSCNHVALQRDPDGFTLRLTAGNPYFPV